MCWVDYFNPFCFKVILCTTNHIKMFLFLFIPLTLRCFPGVSAFFLPPPNKPDRTQTEQSEEKTNPEPNKYMKVWFN